MGETVLNRATKDMEHVDKVKCRVIVIPVQHYKSEILEGPAQCQKHVYLHASVTIVKADGHGALHQVAPAGALGPVLHVFTGFLRSAPLNSARLGISGITDLGIEFLSKRQGCQ